MKCPLRERDGVSDSLFNLPKEDEWGDRNGIRICSYCGGVHPDDFMNRLEKGERLVPTDKPYKVYLGDTARDKFYFEHLSPDQRMKFIDMVNGKKLALGYPGHFYILPYFMEKA